MTEPSTFEEAQAELEQIVSRLEQGQASLDGDDEVVRLGIEDEEVEHGRRARNEVRAEGRERGAEPAGGSRAGEVSVRRQSRVGAEAPLQLGHLLRRRTLLRPVETRCV